MQLKYRNLLHGHGRHSGAGFTVGAGGAVFSLPYTYEFNDHSGDADDLVATDASWSVPAWAAQDYKIVETGLADPEGHTPDGLIKAAFGDSLGDSAALASVFAMPGSTPEGEEGVRIAMLARGGVSNRGCSTLYGTTDEDYSDTSALHLHISRNQTGGSWSRVRYTDGGSLATENNWGGTTAIDGGGTIGSNWVWQCLELNFTAETVTGRHVRDKDGKGYYETVAMSTEGKALGETFSFDKLLLLHGDTSAADRDHTIAKLWVGGLTDDWPA